MTHTSPRALRALRVETEVRRANRDGVLATIQEIQARYNFTEDAAQSFLRSVKTAIRKGSPRATKVIELATSDALTLGGEPQERASRVNAEPSKVRIAGLQAILEDIRKRYGEEIRLHGEQTAVREGFVYLVTHPCFSGWVKAGMTIDYEMRMRTYNICDPLSRFELFSAKWAKDRRLAEKDLLEKLNSLAHEMRGEWARIELEVALSTLESL